MRGLPEQILLLKVVFQHLWALNHQIFLLSLRWKDCQARDYGSRWWVNNCKHKFAVYFLIKQFYICKHETTGYFWLDFGTFSSHVSSNKAGYLCQDRGNLQPFCVPSHSFPNPNQALFVPKHTVLTTSRWILYSTNINIAKWWGSTCQWFAETFIANI